MLLAEVAATSDAVAATRSRLAKRAAIADLLRRVADDAEAGSAEVEIAVAYLAGELRQRRTGLGWRSLRDLPAPAEEPGLTLTDVDAAFARMADLSGPGSSTARQAEAAALFGAATAREQSLLAGLVSGELRQGALDSVVVDAVAEAAGVPADAVRRAVMLAGATGPVARAALTAGGPEAAAEALATFRLTVGRPVRPMLAQSAPDVGAALDKLGAAPGGEDASGTAVAVDVKLDGIRIQVHRDGDDVRVFTRSLDDITERVPEIVAAVRALPGRALVLDGEALVVGPDGVPRPFQETAARSATQGERSAAEEAELAASLELSPFFFDVLHADGRDLLDEPLRDRLAVLDDLLADLLADAAGPLAVRRLVTDDAAAATAFFDAAVAEGQEGVVVKSLDAPYAAGRRGAGWVKVKPRHTLDLVVLAVERGSGRRSGWLSNIWLGARDPEGGFVMLGKTFKGMTDEMLAWQTQRFRELQTADEGYVVHVRPEQVVEIAFDGLQRSTRYPGGLALRFARVVRYRDDKTAAEADTIDTVRALARPLGGGAAEAPDAEG
ncbi:MULTISPECIES: ATP-dependent DNA ligase [Cellulosimicrobium]|uniref:Probable DNA ligase n=1 Tax=Cellulosimicrobium funkei TaxID=264251 RepID=A0A4Y8R943_9MICO|nr:ATP-dependent DNA ligase [Cellulosimicrobium funkei]TFF17386.1 ATP-dependent DNA ligase [Cellulosimicrobium funkei]TGA74086.1 ATP-dependent DNA ligase [Cellulosimicrobium terreum]